MVKHQAIAGLLVLLPLCVSAHHSRAEYDATALTELSGTVERVIWTNPHVRLTVSVVDENGARETWQLEGMDVTRLDRAGIPRDLIAPGMAVRVAGDPSTRRQNAMYVKHVLLPNDTEILLSSGIEPRWPEATGVIGSDYPPATAAEGNIDDVTASAENVNGIFRVWFPGSIVNPDFADDPPFTDFGRTAFNAYESSTDDPVLDCTPPGMPRVMTRTGFRPIEFVDAGDRIIVQLEPFALVREIDMREGAPAIDMPHRPLGYSQGLWDDNTLVVTTSGIDWPYFQLYGFEGAPQSSEAIITERFTLSDDEQTLVYDIATNDPVVFRRTVSASRYRTYQWRPGGRLMPYQECTTPLGG